MIRATNIKAVVVASETVEEKMTIDLLQFRVNILLDYMV